MISVIAKISFDDDRLGRVKKGQKLELAPALATTFKNAGLVTFCGDDGVRPKAASGAKLSASPAGLVSPQTIVKESARGGKKGQAAP